MKSNLLYYIETNNQREKEKGLNRETSKATKMVRRSSSVWWNDDVPKRRLLKVERWRAAGQRMVRWKLLSSPSLCSLCCRLLLGYFGYEENGVKKKKKNER